MRLGSPLQRALLMVARRFNAGLCLFLAIVLFSINPHPAQGQVTSDLIDIFIDRSVNTPTPSAPDTLYLVSARTGLSSVFMVNGTDYQLLSSGILYHDRQTHLPMILSLSGQLSPAAFMSTQSDQVRGWIASADQNWIAWGEAHTEANSLLSDLYLSRADGSQKRLALHTSSTSGITTLPIAISRDGQSIVYTRQAITTAASLYFTAADLSVWTANNASTHHLAGEPFCACAAAASPDGKTVFRLDRRLTAHLIDQNTGADLTITPPASLINMVAGDALFDPNGGLVAYSVATSADPRIARYGVVLVDSAKQVQEVLIPPGAIRYQPIAFEQDSLLLAEVNQNGTVRLSFSGGNPASIAADSYLGTVGD